MCVLLCVDVCYMSTTLLSILLLVNVPRETNNRLCPPVRRYSPYSPQPLTDIPPKYRIFYLANVASIDTAETDRKFYGHLPERQTKVQDYCNSTDRSVRSLDRYKSRDVVAVELVLLLQ